MAIPRIAITCVVCGTVRQYYASYIEQVKGAGTYCSNACRVIGCRKHGEAINETAEYRAWAAMKSRCLDPSVKSYANYGALGVGVFPAWIDDYRSFLAYVGRRPSETHSIDRFPNGNGNYEPGNVRWATKSEQARNTRCNRMLTFNGETLCLIEWADKLGVKDHVLRNRLIDGWSVERALTTPLKVYKKRKPKPPISASPART